MEKTGQQSEPSMAQRSIPLVRSTRTTPIDDEPFWERQERRRRGQLGQPCCTQSKMSWALVHMPGNFALVIHGEQDCLNCFHHHTGPSPQNVYSTRLTEYQITSGETQRPLRHLLELLAKERNPDAIVVLGTCPVEVIGDRFETVTDEVSTRLGIPIAALHTSGLKMTRLVDMQDWLFSTLAGMATQERPLQRRSFQTIGLLREGGIFPEFEEVIQGLELIHHGEFPNQSFFANWDHQHAPEKSFVVDASTFPKLTETLGSQGHEILEIPLPVGVQQTTRFYEQIGDAFDIRDKLEELIAQKRDTALHMTHDFRSRVEGFPIAMAIRMLNTYRSDQLAYDGLVDYVLLKELGLRVTLFIQGPPEEKSAFESTLKTKYGVEDPVEVFPGPWVLGEHLRDLGFRHAIAPDSCTTTLRKNEVAVLPSRSFPMFYSGVPSSIHQIHHLLR